VLIDSRPLIKRFIYMTKKADIVKLVLVLVELACKNDAEAIGLFKQVGDELAVMTRDVIRNLQVLGRVDVAVSGSVLEKIPWVRERFEQGLSGLCSEVRVLNEGGLSNRGGYYLVFKSEEFVINKEDRVVKDED